MSRLALTLAVTCALVAGAGAAGYCCSNDADCDDGDACNGVESCDLSSGTCVPGTAVDCTDQNPCTDDLCDPATGACSNPEAAAGTVCDDGNACTTGDTCSDGVCVGAALSCDDGNPCTDDSCDPATGCVSTPNTAPCDDRNACTTADTCSGGHCGGGPAPNCDDGNACTDDVCNAATGCVNSPYAARCDDGNACTRTDTCQAGTCTGTNPVTCPAQDQCHDAGTCDPTTGTCSNPAKPNGTACDDGSACTRSDTCQAGACTGANPVTCPAPDQCHDAGTCDPATGTCSNPAKPNGMACDDHDACTRSDTCQAATCTGTDPVTCKPLDQCHSAGTCDPVTGACSNPQRPDGAACDDANPCTTGDRCQAGACSGTAVACTPSDQCHDAGTCDPATGTCSNPSSADGRTCNDGDACTAGDRCAAGRCAGTAIDCDDGLSCTDDSCAQGACQHVPVDARCDTGTCAFGTCRPADPGADRRGCVEAPVNEGEACTDDGFSCTDDVCTEGRCLHVPIDSRCVPPDDCTAAICAPARAGHDGAGCSPGPSRADGEECAEDGDPCTDDLCFGGHCAHEPVPSQTTCAPVTEAFRWALALQGLVRGLSADVGQYPDGAGMTQKTRDLLLARLRAVEADFDATARVLAGKPGETSGEGAHPASPTETPAQERARVASGLLRRMDRDLRLLVRTVPGGDRTPLARIFYADLRRRGRLLMRGTRTLKTELRRLQQETHSFAR